MTYVIVFARVKEMVAYKHAQKYVEQKVGENTFLSMLKHVKRSKPDLYSTEQPPGFYRVMTTLVLYHDLTGIGWRKLVEKINTPFHVPHSSLWHNAKVIRKFLNTWALQQVPHGTPKDWTTAARHSAFKKPVRHATLAIDSFDLTIQRKGRRRGKKSPYWSGKLNRPGWRFMLITDASRRARLISSRYSPKIYDGHWLEARRDDIEVFFKGGVFVADTHFQVSIPFDDVTFYITTPARRHDSDMDDDPDMVKLIKWEEERNKAIRHARARIELAISHIKSPWKVLSTPWAEELNQLSYLVHIAVAVYNLSL